MIFAALLLYRCGVGVYQCITDTIAAATAAAAGSRRKSKCFVGGGPGRWGRGLGRKITVSPLNPDTLIHNMGSCSCRYYPAVTAPGSMSMRAPQLTHPHSRKSHPHNQVHHINIRYLLLPLVLILIAIFFPLIVCGGPISHILSQRLVGLREESGQSHSSYHVREEKASLRSMGLAHRSSTDRLNFVGCRF